MTNLTTLSELNSIALYVASAVIVFASVCRLGRLDRKRHQLKYAIPYFLFAGALAFAVIDDLQGRPPPFWMTMLVVGLAVLIVSYAKQWGSDGAPDFMEYKTMVDQRNNMLFYTPLVCGVVLLSLITYAQTTGVPFAYLAPGHANPAQVRAGQPVTIEWYIQRYRECPSEVDVLWTTYKNELVATETRRPGGAALVGVPKTVSVRTVVPAHLKPGKYRYQSITKSECSAFSEYVTRSPYVVVDVIP